MPKISFVLPIYNEAGTIPHLWKELLALKEQLDPWETEFIFVDDCSRDTSLELLKELYAEFPQVIKILSFSRNYGHQIAVTAGQDIATGDAVIIMDSDLQDPPSVCLELIAKWQEGYDVVYAKRRKYKTNFMKEVSAFLFYRLMTKIANIQIPEDTGDFRLISQRVNEEMKKYREHSRFLRGISSLVGFKQTAVLFDRQPRFAGTPGYTFWKSLRLALDGITGFSFFPIRLVSLVGVAFACIGFLAGLIYIFFSIISGHVVEGWASLMFAVTFLGGVQLLMLGIIGEYIGRIYTEVLKRPLYTIAQKIGVDQ